MAGKANKRFLKKGPQFLAANVVLRNPDGPGSVVRYLLQDPLLQIT